MAPLPASACECGRILLPPRDRCLFCSGSTQPVETGNIGIILTYTVLHVVPQGCEPPLILGLIQLERDLELHGSDSTPILPKLVCVGDIPEDEIQMGLTVRVTKVGERYHFERM